MDETDVEIRSIKVIVTKMDGTSIEYETNDKFGIVCFLSDKDSCLSRGSTPNTFVKQLILALGRTIELMQKASLEHYKQNQNEGVNG